MQTQRCHICIHLLKAKALTQPGIENTVINYKGEYHASFEALWAIAKRIKYREAEEKTIKHCIKK